MHISINRQVRYGLQAPERQWGAIFLRIFAAMQWFSLGRALLVTLLGDWVEQAAGWLNATSVFILVLSSVWFARKYGFRINGISRLWWLLVAGFVAANTARGLSQGLLVKYVTYDALSFAVILCFVVLGSIPEAFQELRKIWFWVLLAAIPLNILALSDLSDMKQELTVGARVARETVSYRTQNALDVITICVAFAFEYPLWKRVIVASGMTLVLLQQVLYQKRLETVFYLLMLVVVAAIWQSVQGELRNKLRNYVFSFCATVFTLFIAIYFAKKELVLPQVEALAGRLIGEANDVQFSSGIIRYALVDNERFAMARDSLAMLEPWELCIGRGMGGGVELHEFNAQVLNTSDRERYWAGYYLEDYGFFGRRGFEMGVAVPILKGGFIFFIVYYWGFAMAIAHTAVVTRTFMGRIALAIVVLLWAYTLFGGDFALSSVFQMANTGACLGYCLGSLSQDQHGIGNLKQSTVGAAPRRLPLRRSRSTGTGM